MTDDSKPVESHPQDEIIQKTDKGFEKPISSGDPNEPAWLGSTSFGLIERIKKKVPGYLEEVIRSHAPLIFRYLKPIPKRDRDDAFQEVLLVILQKIDGFERRHPKALRGWINQIARNKVGDYLREHRLADVEPVGGSTQQAILQGISDETEPESQEPSEHEENLILLKSARHLIERKFEPKTIEAAYRAIVGKEPIAVIAESLNMTETAVRIAKSRVLKCLRDYLEGDQSP